jgi:hypothetical protein
VTRLPSNLQAYSRAAAPTAKMVACGGLMPRLIPGGRCQQTSEGHRHGFAEQPVEPLAMGLFEYLHSSAEFLFLPSTWATVFKREIAPSTNHDDQ